MRSAKHLSLLWVVLGLFVGVAVAEQPGASPRINQPYVNPDYSTWVERFESPGREVYDHRDAVVTASGVKPGMAVADVGAGTGLFTELFARAVGSKGKVYAVDVSPEFIRNIELRMKKAGFGNVTGVQSSQEDTKLAPGSVDLVFICDTYHHFEKPRAMLASIRRALRPGGALVIVDFERVEGKSSGWIMHHVRAGKDVVIREVEAAGFQLRESELKALNDNFFLRFARSK